LIDYLRIDDDRTFALRPIGSYTYARAKTRHCVSGARQTLGRATFSNPDGSNLMRQRCVIGHSYEKFRTAEMYATHLVAQLLDVRR
jgi:hypothetical protein